ncbi:MAG: 4-hydroxy-3-methylbut-2-en-1-yl diphosphate synthase [Campylobacter curvus]
MAEKQKSFWPYGILLAIILCVAACVATIIISLNHPVQLDSFYMDRYQNVDENINEIKAAQGRFEEKFSVGFGGAEFKNLQGRFEFMIAPKSGELSNLNAKILLTRPETNEFNKELGSSFQGQILKTDEISLPKEGRWQILLKLNDGNDTGFYRFDFNATH